MGDGEQQPYVTASLLPERAIVRRTQASLIHGLEPEWTAEHRNVLQLNVTNSPDSKLVLEVHAENLGEDKLIGTCAVDFLGLPFLQLMELAIPIDSGGELEVRTAVVRCMTSSALTVLSDVLQVTLYRHGTSEGVMKALIPQLSSLHTRERSKAALALANLAHHEGSQLEMMRLGILAPLTKTLQEEAEPEVICSCLETIANLSAHDETPAMIVDQQIVSIISRFLNPLAPVEVQSSCMNALCNISAHETTPATLVFKNKICSIIFPLVQSPNLKIRINCAKMMANLAAHKDTPIRMVEQGAVSAIIDLLQSEGGAEMETLCSETLLSLSGNRDALPGMLDGRVMDALTNLLMSNKMSVKADAVETIHNLCIIDDLKYQMVEAGLVQSLIPLMKSPSPHDLIANCVRVLLNMSIHSETPLLMLGEGVLDVLTPLIKVEDVQMRSHCAQAIMNLLHPLVITSVQDEMPSEGFDMYGI